MAQNAKSKTKAKSKSQFEDSEPVTLSEWLATLFGIYNPRPDIAGANGYTLALADLTQANLRLAFMETLRAHKSSFPPTPGEIREYLAIAKERNPQPRTNAHENCLYCGGTGMETIASPDGRIAIPCRNRMN